MSDRQDTIWFRSHPPRLCGCERDTVFPVEYARGMVAQFRGAARLLEVPGARFLVHEERPQVVAEAVSASLTG